MSYVVQGLCVISALFGIGVMGKMDSAKAGHAAVAVLVGLPAVVFYFAGVGRKLLEKVERMEKKLEESATPESP